MQSDGNCQYPNSPCFQFRHSPFFYSRSSICTYWLKYRKTRACRHRPNVSPWPFLNDLDTRRTRVFQINPSRAFFEPIRAGHSKIPKVRPEPAPVPTVNCTCQWLISRCGRSFPRVCFQSSHAIDGRGSSSIMGVIL